MWQIRLISKEIHIMSKNYDLKSCPFCGCSADAWNNRNISEEADY